MSTVFDNLGLYASGFGFTLLLFAVVSVVAVVVGTVLATFRVSPIPPLRGFGLVYVEVFRNLPLTMIFFFTVFVAPQFGLTIPFTASAILALSLYTSAFTCEAVRSGINSVAAGQAEAARSLGLTFPQVLGSVVVPQAVRSVLPPLVNVLIALAKNTSVAGGFFVAELFNVGRRLSNSNSGDVVWILIAVAIGYLVITVPLGSLANTLERRVAVAR